jgi:hypothetical protein
MLAMDNTSIHRGAEMGALYVESGMRLQCFLGSFAG